MGTLGLGGRGDDEEGRGPVEGEVGVRIAGVEIQAVAGGKGKRGVGGGVQDKRAAEDVQEFLAGMRGQAADLRQGCGGDGVQEGVHGFVQKIACQKAGAQAGTVEGLALVRAGQGAGAGLGGVGEEGRDIDAKVGSQAVKMRGGDLRVSGLDARQRCLGDAGLGGEIGKGQALGKAQGTDARAEGVKGQGGGHRGSVGLSCRIARRFQVGGGASRGHETRTGRKSKGSAAFGAPARRNQRHLGSARLFDGTGLAYRAGCTGPAAGHRCRILPGAPQPPGSAYPVHGRRCRLVGSGAAV